MNPDDKEQFTRLVTLGLAVHWTANVKPDAEDVTFGDLFGIAERFRLYIEHGLMGCVD
jgi:hypothetical protein